MNYYKLIIPFFIPTLYKTDTLINNIHKEPSGLLLLHLLLLLTFKKINSEKNNKNFTWRGQKRKPFARKISPMQRGTAGAGVGGGGLSRYRSAPATWLEALLESDTESEVVLHPSSPILHTPNKPPPHPSTQKLPELKPETGFPGDPGLFESGGTSNFLRQNSSPAEFLSQISSDGYFSNYGIPASLDFLPSSVDVSQSAKRARDGDSESSPRKLSSQLVSIQFTNLPKSWTFIIHE